MWRWSWLCTLLAGYSQSVPVRNEYLSKNSGSSKSSPSWRENGCAPIDLSTCPPGYRNRTPTLLVSLDGFWAGYLKWNITPAISHFGSCGIQAVHTVASHPTITFPNHYSIATGLNTESHGIVDNVFYDYDLHETFSYKNKSSSMKPQWWNGEPIWVTAKKNGKRSRSYFWVGSEVPIKNVQPDVWLDYNQSHPFETRVDTVLDWLSLPDESRPDITTLYFEEPDASGHRFGPLPGGGVETALEKVDMTIDRLMNGLADRKILGCVNILIVSDHGMQEASCNSTLGVQQQIRNSSLKGTRAAEDVVVYGQSCQARISLPPGPANFTMEDLYDALSCPVTRSAFNSPYQPYKKQNLPRRLHYSNSNRIEPIVMDLQAGYTVFKSNFGVCPNNGVHGYDNVLYSSMESIFLAGGPAFKSGLVVEPFKNIEIYNLLCELLNVQPAPNNGTFGSLHHLLRQPRTITKAKKASTAPTDVHAPTLTGGGDPRSRRSYTAESELPFSASVSTRLLKQHAPMGIPELDADSPVKVVTSQHDVAGFSEEFGMPLWSSFMWTRKHEVSTGGLVSMVLDSGELDDTGHLSCANGSTLEPTPIRYRDDPKPNDLREMNLSTILDPMYCAFRTGVWTTFWTMITNWSNASTSGRLHVQVGPVFDSAYPYGLKDSMADIKAVVRNESGLPTPSHYFAVVTRSQSNDFLAESDQLDVLAFLLPHVALDPEERCQNERTYIWTHSASVDDVEKVTGLKFYGELPVYDAIRLRVKQPLHLWE